MASFVSTIDLPASPEASWAFVVDRGGEIEPLSFEPRGAQGVNMLNDLSGRIAGIPIRAVSRTVVWDPPERCVFESVKPTWPISTRITETFALSGRRHSAHHPLRGETRRTARPPAREAGVQPHATKSTSVPGSAQRGALRGFALGRPRGRPRTLLQIHSSRVNILSSPCRSTRQSAWRCTRRQMPSDRTKTSVTRRPHRRSEPSGSETNSTLARSMNVSHARSPLTPPVRNSMLLLGGLPSHARLLGDPLAHRPTLHGSPPASTSRPTRMASGAAAVSLEASNSCPAFPRR